MALLEGVEGGQALSARYPVAISVRVFFAVEGIEQRLHHFQRAAAVVHVELRAALGGARRGVMVTGAVPPSPAALQACARSVSALAPLVTCTMLAE
jgi:hypothetical protein